MKRITLKRIAIAAAIVTIILIQAYLETSLGFTPNHWTNDLYFWSIWKASQPKLYYSNGFQIRFWFQTLRLFDVFGQLETDF